MAGRRCATCKAPVFETELGTQWHARGHGYCAAYQSGHYETEEVPMSESNMVKSGENLREGAWYRIVELDPSDPNPSLKVGDVLECKAQTAGCIDPENKLDDGMGAEWFADYDNVEAYRTLVTKVELVSITEAEFKASRVVGTDQ